MGTVHNSTSSIGSRLLGKQTPRAKRKKPNTTIISTYVGVFLLVVTLVAIGYQPPQRVENTAALANVSDPVKKSTVSSVSVDETVATAVASDLAERANLPIVSHMSERLVSLEVKSDLAQDDTSTITKPQIIDTKSDDRAISKYVAKAGDTVPEVAARYGVSATTIKWANNLQSDALDVGKELKILPIDGVIYIVKEGDTSKSIADRYSADEARIVTYNDLEIDGLKPGSQIVLPAANLPSAERPGYVAPRTASYMPSYGGSAYNASVSAGNRYAYGWCTWYAYERRAQMGRTIGSFWGNASSWAYSARAAGFTVNNEPAAGAIFQTGGGYSGMGHVGIIDSVDHASGTGTYSDMNGIAGFGRVGSRTISLGDAKARWMFIH